MYRLKDLNKQIPNGYKYYQPETKWKPAPWSSFSSVVDQLTSHRNGNRGLLVEHHGWPVDRPSVEQQVEQFNVQICLKMGWKDYVTGTDGPPPDPKSQPRPLLKKLQDVAGGGGVIIDWIANKAEAVSLDQANTRAATCLQCPKHGKGDWTRYFTLPTVFGIRKMLQRKNEFGLRTDYDDQIKVCEACGCPLLLKLWLKIDRIIKDLSPEQKAELQPENPRCWILSESQ